VCALRSWSAFQGPGAPESVRFLTRPLIAQNGLCAAAQFYFCYALVCGGGRGRPRWSAVARALRHPAPWPRWGFVVGWTRARAAVANWSGCTPPLFRVGTRPLVQPDQRFLAASRAEVSSGTPSQLGFCAAAQFDSARLAVPLVCARKGFPARPARLSARPETKRCRCLWQYWNPFSPPQTGMKSAYLRGCS
jgi:hypothetical protein